VPFERVEMLHPEAPVRLEPGVDLRQRLGAKLVEPPLGVLAASRHVLTGAESVAAARGFWCNPRSPMVTAQLEQLLVAPGTPARLAERDPGDTLGLAKEEAKQQTKKLRDRIDELQYLLYAEARRAVLLLLQGLDASGKDGVIRRVFSGVNPQGVRVTPFKAPAGAELEHDYLWRIHAALPPRGTIGVFNRSHYEDVVTVGVLGLFPEEVWRRRAGHIREFERMLAEEGTTTVKVFLNVSRDKQRERLQERIDDPRKRWKFNPGDLEVNERYDEYLAAYEAAITETATDWAPWHVVPADRNWVKAYATASILCETLERLDPRLPSGATA
jgi:PPK2 family polyphosphate:nucleotide phosphotransferase